MKFAGLEGIGGLKMESNTLSLWNSLADMHIQLNMYKIYAYI